MFVKILRDKGQFVYINKNHIVHVEPNQNGIGTTVTLTTVGFYSPQSLDEVLAIINN